MKHTLLALAFALTMVLCCACATDPTPTATLNEPVAQTTSAPTDLPSSPTATEPPPPTATPTITNIPPPTETPLPTRSPVEVFLNEADVLAYIHCVEFYDCGDIALMDVSLGYTMTLWSDVDALDVAWSPDGGKLAFVGEDQETFLTYIEITSIMDGEVLLHVSLEQYLSNHPYDLAWSPDEGTLLYTIPVKNGANDTTIEAIDIAFGRRYTPEWVPQNVFSASGPAYAPNGEFILYAQQKKWVLAHTWEDCFGNYGVYQFWPADGTRRLLFDCGDHAIVSADSKYAIGRVFCQKEPVRNEVIRRLNLDTGVQVALVDHANSPAIDPAGKRLAYVVDFSKIMLLDIPSGETRELALGLEPAWRPIPPEPMADTLYLLGTGMGGSNRLFAYDGIQARHLTSRGWTFLARPSALAATTWLCGASIPSMTHCRWRCMRRAPAT